jgi:hypothetical protein
MTAELVRRLGAIDYRGDRPCVPQSRMAELAIALDRPRQKLIARVLELIRKRYKHHEQNPSFRAS